MRTQSYKIKLKQLQFLHFSPQDNLIIKPWHQKVVGYMHALKNCNVLYFVVSAINKQTTGYKGADGRYKLQTPVYI